MIAVLGGKLAAPSPRRRRAFRRLEVHAARTPSAPLRRRSHRRRRQRSRAEAGSGRCCDRDIASRGRCARERRIRGTASGSQNEERLALHALRRVRCPPRPSRSVLHRFRCRLAPSPASVIADDCATSSPSARIPPRRAEHRDLRLANAGHLDFHSTPLSTKLPLPARPRLDSAAPRPAALRATSRELARCDLALDLVRSFAGFVPLAASSHRSCRAMRRAAVCVLRFRVRHRVQRRASSWLLEESLLPRSLQRGQRLVCLGDLCLRGLRWWPRVPASRFFLLGSAARARVSSFRPSRASGAAEFVHHAELFVRVEVRGEW